MHAAFFIGVDKIPDNKDRAEQKENAAVNGACVIGEFEPRNIKVSAPFPGNKTEITGQIPGIRERQYTCEERDNAEEYAPGQFADRFAGIVKTEQGDECSYAGDDAGLYSVGNKGRFQSWGNFFQKTAEGIKANRQGGAAKVLHTGLTPIVEDEDQDGNTDYQVNAGYNLYGEYVHLRSTPRFRVL
jgi:hypothetical protein